MKKLTEKDLIAECKYITFEQGTIIPDKNTGKWHTTDMESPAVDSAVEAYQWLKEKEKEKCVKCGENRKAPDSDVCESCSTYLKPSSDAKTTKVGEYNI